MKGIEMKVVHDGSASTCQFIQSILAAAQAHGKYGAVAKCLVRAKLQLRFPQLVIDKEPSPGQQPGNLADFCIAGTAFYVSVAPSLPLYERIRDDINHGWKIYLLVPEPRVVGAWQNAVGISVGKITVTSIEVFVSQNIDELSKFDPQEQRSQLAALLALYNQRVDAVESDKSLMIEIPATLGK
jgi:hypothetical protein